MTEIKYKTTSSAKTLIVFITTIIIGYALFIIPDVFFGVTKINGGKIGINLLFIALFQFFSITALLYISLGHLPPDTLEWVDILIPTIMYTLLFISTKRLTASILAHGSYNMAAILLTYYIYFN